MNAMRRETHALPVAYRTACEPRRASLTVTTVEAGEYAAFAACIETGRVAFVERTDVQQGNREVDP